MPSTPSERLPVDAVFYRAYKNVPADWQEVFDALLLQYRTPNFWLNDENGITPEQAAYDWNQLIARFYVSEICQAIADCITETTEDAPENLPTGIYNLYQALNTYNQTYGGASGIGVPIPIDDNVILDNCSDDLLFGAATQLVDYLHIVTTDIQERIAIVSTSFPALVAEVADNFPGVATFTVYTDVLVWFVDFFNANYQAAYTSQVRDDLRCAIYCAWKENNCQSTLTNILAVLLEEAGLTANPNDDLNAIWAQIINVVSGKALVASIWAGVMVASLAGSKFWGVPNRALMRQALTAFSNDPDSDWSIVCDPCGPGFCSFIDFVNDAAGDFHAWPDNRYAVYQAGVGWKQSNVSGFKHVCYIEYIYPTEQLLTSCEARITVPAGLYFTINAYDALDNNVGVSTLSPDGLTATINFGTATAVKKVRVQAQESAASGPTLLGAISYWQQYTQPSAYIGLNWDNCP